MQELHDRTVNRGRVDAGLFEFFFALVVDIYLKPRAGLLVILAEVVQSLDGDVFGYVDISPPLYLDAYFCRDGVEFFAVPYAIVRRFSLRCGEQGMRYIAPVVAVRRRAARDVPRDVARDDRVVPGAADTLIRAFFGRYDTARTLNADFTANTRQTEFALRLLRLVTIKLGGYFHILCGIQYIHSGKI
jgi:hypothetical protein